MSPRAALLASVVFAAMVGGCATVRPWERERLSRRCMELEGSAPHAGFSAHLRSVRVGDVQPGAQGGGGCGCN